MLGDAGVRFRLAIVATLSFIVPTHREDRPLRRCLDSIKNQILLGDEVIVVGDTHDDPLLGVKATVERYGFRYMAYDAGHHCYGHCQLNYAIARAKGDYINVNDDDDVWLPDAAELMRKGVGIWPGSALLFRFRSQFGTLYWDEVGALARDHIGGHCLVAPTAYVGRFECGYNGDFDYVAETVNALGGPQRAIWINSVVAHARP